MEQQANPINEIVKQLKGMMGFMTPQITFIINASFAVVAFLLFILQGEYSSLASYMFKYAGGILFFLAFLGLTASSALCPLKNKKLNAGVNYFLIGFMFLTNLLSLHWGIITILLVVLVLLPWALFTMIKKDDEVSL
ncbi:MAG: hypothetical protein IKL83_05100 [Muribaculaceae bacterium]|nr:hypothetical protein [Muribaculaceae bacterium]